jgi:hypothetical protein
LPKGENGLLMLLLPTATTTPARWASTIGAMARCPVVP